jgi:hypothetical protein
MIHGFIKRLSVQASCIHLELDGYAPELLSSYLGRRADVQLARSGDEVEVEIAEVSTSTHWLVGWKNLTFESEKRQPLVPMVCAATMLTET